MQGYFTVTPDMSERGDLGLGQQVTRESRMWVACSPETRCALPGCLWSECHVGQSTGSRAAHSAGAPGYSVIEEPEYMGPPLVPHQNKFVYNLNILGLLKVSQR